MRPVVVTLIWLFVSCNEIVYSHVDNVSVDCVYEIVIFFDRKRTCSYHFIFFHVAFVFLVGVLLSFENWFWFLLFMFSFFWFFEPCHRWRHYGCVCCCWWFVGYDDFFSPCDTFFVFGVFLFWSELNCFRIEVCVFEQHLFFVFAQVPVSW